MYAVRFKTGQKSSANEIADSTGFERAGWLEIFEFEEYTTAELISERSLACGSGSWVKRQCMI